MLLLPGYPGLSLFHIAVIFAEGDEREVEGAPAAFAPLCIVASHRHQDESGGRCSPPTSTIILAAPQTQNSIFFLLLNQER